MKTYLTLFLLLILSNAVFAQENKHSHDEHLNSLVNSYLDMKSALTTDNFEDAKSALQDFSKEVKMNTEMTDHPQHSEMHAKHHSSMIAAVEAASAATSLDEFRESFDEISNELIKAVKNQNYDQELHIQFCPMAGSGDGAKWLSENEEIRNPYFGSGSMMAECGTTVETLK